jgi:hypothetical protein
MTINRPHFTTIPLSDADPIGGAAQDRNPSTTCIMGLLKP